MRLARLMQFHEDPVVIALWRERLGPVLDWLTPARRRLMLAAGAVWMGATVPMDMMTRMARAKGLTVPQDPLGQAAVVCALFGLLWLCYRAAVGFTALPAVVRQRPQLALHGLFWCLLATLWFTASSEGPWRPILTGIAIALPFLLWRMGYMLLSGQRGRAAGTAFTDHLMYLWPVFGGSNTPYGKGLDYLSRHEAKTSDELARAQLAGLKLLLLSAIWSVSAKLMDGVVYADPKSTLTPLLAGYSLAVPRLGRLIGHHSEVGLVMSWASIYCELVWQVLNHAVYGHTVIGVLRLAGFSVFRNVYKPLLAESIVEFWNRYYYYFKELLVEFFFLPTFARRFRKSPRLRLFAAVFAAAALGNMYYHMLQREDLLIRGDFATLWSVFNSRVFYCVLLAVGLFVSMLRAQSRGAVAPAPGEARRCLRIFGVWTFFALIFIWNARGPAPFLARTDFFLGLFGLA